jgi:hypothetical protein
MEKNQILKRAIYNNIGVWDSISKETLMLSIGNTIDFFFDMYGPNERLAEQKKKRERSPSPIPESIDSSSSSEEEELQLSDEEDEVEVEDDDGIDGDGGGNYYYYDQDEESLRHLIAQIKDNGLQELRSCNWFKRRYGGVLEGIRANMGAQDKNQKDAHAHFDTLTHGSNEVIIQRHPGKTKCCFCNKTKACNQTLKTPKGDFPIARCCGKLASAVIAFFKHLADLVESDNDGSGFIGLDRAFKAVMDASEKK